MQRETLKLIIEVSIKNDMQSQAVVGVATVLHAIDCISDADFATLYALATDCPFIL